MIPVLNSTTLALPGCHWKISAAVLRYIGARLFGPWAIGNLLSKAMSVNALIVDRFFESGESARRDRVRAGFPRGDAAQAGRGKASVRSLTRSRGLKANLDGSLKP
jgi:hypothetical protein